MSDEKLRRYERFNQGSIYVKLNDTNAILNALSLIDKANDLVPSLKAKGIIVFGDFNARHTAWGDSQNNRYRMENN